MLQIVKPTERSIQVEDGYTRIANDLLDALLQIDLTKNQWAVAVAVIRKTYGYNKKQDDISASQIGAACGMERTHVTATLNQLAARNIIHKKHGEYGCIVGIQKDISVWIPAKPITKTSRTKIVLVRNSSEDRTDSVQVDRTTVVHTKDNLPKDNQQKTGPTPPAAPAKERKITFRKWLELKKAAGEKPIPEEHAVFAYADTIGLPMDYVRIAWMQFKHRYADSKKCYIDWAKVFHNAVRENWFHIWFEGSVKGQWSLTTAGKQMEVEFREVRHGHA